MIVRAMTAIAANAAVAAMVVATDATVVMDAVAARAAVNVARVTKHVARTVPKVHRARASRPAATNRGAIGDRFCFVSH